MSYLLTGTGRCGTGYVARLLTEAGYACGHELEWGLNNYQGAELHTYKHESSWLCMGRLATSAPEYWPNVVHVTRDVQAVALSLARTRVMADLEHGYGRVHAEACPMLHQVTNPAARGWVWIGWVHGVLESVPRWDVSEPVEKLAEIMGLDMERLHWAARRVPGDVNARPRKLPGWWVDE